MSDNTLLLSVSEWDALRAQLQQAEDERDAARKWAAAWKRAAKHREGGIAWWMTECYKEIAKKNVAQVAGDNALRVVAAARDWIETGQSPYHEGLVAAVREWEAQAQVRE